MVQRADAALYASKEAGRNCLHWHDGQKIIAIHDEEDHPRSAEGAHSRLRPFPRPPPEPAQEEAVSIKLADDLPAILNRTAFCQHVRSRLAEWKRGGSSITLVLVEIDHFEKLGRLYGSNFRDLLVTSLARVVFAGVREMDIVACYSPNCLAFLLPNARLSDAVRVADRIREAATQVAIPAGNTKVGFTISAGLVEGASADDMVTLFLNAETAPQRRRTARRKLPLHS